MTEELSDERKDEIKRYLWEKFSIKTENISVYDETFTHSTCGIPNNQRLAFLGDRVFDLIVAEHLLNTHPGCVSGMLDGERQRIHNETAQTAMAKEIGLIGPMVFGKTYENIPKEELEKNTTIMSEALEAMLGAMYSDKGLEKARGVLVGLVPQSRNTNKPGLRVR
ncbi:MAG: hypothetical protein KAW39_00975 [Thermoplasmata archaeon]|nr:hypothetical protein [Thermoplasmata archaeon]